MKAIWNDTVIAESDNTIEIEQNHYFPRESVRMDLLEKSGNTYTCHWKGVCEYYHVVVNGQKNPDAAWIYERPEEAAKQIAGYVAFWKGIEIVK